MAKPDNSWNKADNALEASNQVIGRLITLEISLELTGKGTDGEGNRLSRADIKDIERTRETLRKVEGDLRRAQSEYREAVRENMRAFNEVESSLDDLSSKSQLMDGYLDAVGVALAAAPVLVFAAGFLPFAALGASTALVVGTGAAVGGYVVSAMRTGDMEWYAHNEEITGLAAGVVDDTVGKLGPEATKAALTKAGAPKLGELLSKGSNRWYGGALSIAGFGSAWVEAFGADIGELRIPESTGATVVYRPGPGESPSATISRLRGEVENAGIGTGTEQARAQRALDRLSASNDEMDRAGRRLLRKAAIHAHFMKHAFDTWVMPR